MRAGSGAEKKETMVDAAAAEAPAVGKIPSGLFIITTVLDGRKEGFLGSWVQQASFSPLLIGIALKPGRACHAAIKAHGRFCVNIVGQNNGGLMKPFWTFKEGVDPFETLEHRITSRGNVVMGNAMAYLECEARSFALPGDHEIVFAEVVDNQILQPEDKPLTHVRKGGLGY
jgi:flavin reductase (DIM6/NTAB) family NADH-FMN oxidoreductase RutF